MMSVAWRADRRRDPTPINNVIGDHNDIPHINRLVEHPMKKFDR